MSTPDSPQLTDEEFNKAMTQIVLSMEPGHEFSPDEIVPAIHELTDIKILAGLWSLWEQDCLSVASRNDRLVWMLTEKGKGLGS